ncbi:MAG: M20/M25/M40 family metallo-hydrolase [Eubacteriales bacterium]|nr:M20/M25/M40 family metallo-hydrolase [Eubacteriales bacterium]
MKDSSLLKSLYNLDNAFGVSGEETEVAGVLFKEMEGLYDEHFEDAMGNQYFVRYGKDKERKILFSAHMDEIGFIINYIEDNGLIRFLPVGYHDDRNAVNQDMIVMTDSGKKVMGVTGAKPAHIMTAEDHEKVQKIEDLFLDVGTTSREETLALGINMGDYIGFAREGYVLNGGKYYTGKAVDDRSACAVMVEVLKRLKGEDIGPTVVMVGSVQEEVGLRAGVPIMNNIDPEVMIALDVTLTGDTPGVPIEKCSQKMGEGPGVKYYDWDPDRAMGNNVSRKVTRAIIKTAEKHGIPFQREVFIGGGTDAWQAPMVGKGYLAGGICIPQRYMHTAVGTIHMDDLENTVKLTEHFIRDYKGL